MAVAGRKSTADATRLVQLTLPVQVDAALERIAKIGYYGRSKSEVVVTLLSREFERIAKDGLIDRLDGLTK
ncbi:hypothetical protein X887_4906 [Burkholderia pseudomallei MSHR4375]|uniref:hypothetical protein n=1 Tax=Burkholderia pseudomallei TaxID=28450 RepID=UPI00052A1B92|nr:hypothetical protein [Burkholderia pseudomallei]AIV66457.1 hypothetical protein X993_4580 [Burkholderia pseudomallei K42]KGV79117.1 hypothetical protein X887_4906 [Burkholderia pseudomallei MSHR4375]